MATAKKLPSGAYRWLIYIGMDENKKRQYKSFTAPTKKEAEFLASQFLMEQKEAASKPTLQFKVAMERYNSLKESVLSPYSITTYIAIKNAQKRILRGSATNIFQT